MKSWVEAPSGAMDVARAQRILRIGALLAAVTYICVLLAGCQGSSGPIEVSDAWAPATPPNASVGAAYMRVETQAADTLLGASTPIAASVEVHETSSDGDMVRMRKLESVPVTPADPATFEPGGRHFMLIGLTAPLQASSHIPLTLRFQNAGEIRVDVEIVTPNASPERQ
jgi:periplasmic copper chaperone A